MHGVKVMERRLTIRAERPDDDGAIRDVVQRAYADVSYSDHREHVMIDRLRQTDAYIASLSLLAEIEGKAAGHILLTRAHIRNGSLAVATLALAPLSVAPEFRFRGVGKRLVGAAHERAGALGFETIVVVGIPGYYEKFGYEPLSRYPITFPFDAPDANCMIFPLAPRALDGLAGRVCYAPGWLEH